MINTVNVLLVETVFAKHEYEENSEIHTIYSFLDDSEGNQKAEELFVKLFNKYTDLNLDKESEVVKEYIENGFFENTYCKIYIIHSLQYIEE